MTAPTSYQLIRDSLSDLNRELIALQQKLAQAPLNRRTEIARTLRALTTQIVETTEALEMFERAE
jgi:hypothetical protein